MRFKALATDYDGTLAFGGEVDRATLHALDRYRAAGGASVLVTGRALDDLASVFPHFARFAFIVAENGALLHDVRADETQELAAPPPERLFQALTARAVPHARGRVLVATLAPHERELVEVIATLGLPLHVVRNKGAAMALPEGVDKASGLRAAAQALHLSLHEIAGIGDAENDRAFLAECGLAAAVATAVPELREVVDVVTAGGAGEGVVELVDLLLRLRRSSRS